MNKLTFISAIAACAILSGCVTGTAVQTGDHTYAPRTDWGGIKIVFEKPNCPYEVIGPVQSLGAPAAHERAVYDMLKQQAAKLGADAVLMSAPGSTAYQDGFRHGKSTTGLAIKYTGVSAH